MPSFVIPPPSPTRRSTRNACELPRPAQLLARRAFLGQLPLHHHLRSDSCMIRTWQPKRTASVHAPPAGQDIHLRLVEHVAHMQTAGNIRWRQQDGEGLSANGRVLFGG